MTGNLSTPVGLALVVAKLMDKGFNNPIAIKMCSNSSITEVMNYDTAGDQEALDSRKTCLSSEL
jgi:hypothetical protein